MSALDKARHALVAAALKVTQETWLDAGVVRALLEAATVYADARRANAPKPTGVSDHRKADVPMPFGRSRGKTLGDAATDDLKWILPKIVESIDDPSKARWRVDNQALADAIETELERR